jgi:TonB-dependent starch-binding outer membrane protein SusC
MFNPVRKAHGILIIVLLLYSLSGYAGQEDPISKVIVNIAIKNESLISALQKIEAKTGYHFMYSKEDLRDIDHLTVAAGKRSVEELLKIMLSNTPLTYKQLENRILIIRRPQPAVREAVALQNELNPLAVKNIVTGQVTNDKGEPLSGVSVMVKGTKTATTTDQDGKFSISLDKEATLVFTYVGFITREIPVNDRQMIDIALLPANNSLGEVVVIGYGTQKRSEITGSISTVSGKDLANVTSGGIQEALQGRAAGVNITPTSGQPGGALDMNIRGVATFGNGNPLFVIDGVPILTEGTSRNFNPLASIPPDNIESIQILKDASAAAIYGARAANGVVLVTTNRGKAGKTRTQIKLSRGVSEVTKFLPLMNSAQYIPYATEAYQNAGRPIPISFQEPLLSKNLLTNSNWQEEGFSSAPITNLFFGTSGGNEFSTYSFSAGYLDEDGTLPQSGFKRYSTNINSDFKIGKRLKIGETIGLSRAVWTGTFNQASSPMRQLNQQSPTVPVYKADANGGFDGPRLEYSPVGRANTIGDFSLFENHNLVNKVIGNVYASIDLLPGLTNKFSVGGELSTGRSFSFIPTYDMGDRVNTLASLTEGRNDENVYLIENTTTYQKVFNDVHKLTALVGFSQQKAWASGTTVTVRNFQSNDLRTVDAGFEQRDISGLETGWAMRSQIGRLNYTYDNRYNVMAVVRRDGSSRFGSNNRYGVFPSISASWNISNERFFTSRPVSSLSLRASYGKVGSQDISNFAQYAVISSDVNYIFGTGQALTPGASYLNMGNPDLKWEVTTQTNVGIDLSLFNRSLSLTLDYYIKNTDDVLVQLPIATTSGIRRNNGPFVNAGSLQNKGFELAVNYQNTAIGGELQYSLSGNISTNKNRVTSLNAGQPIIAQLNSGKQSSFTITQEGGEIGAFYGYVMEGIIKDADDLAKHATQDGSAPGDVKFKDLDGNGVINALDQTVIGSPSPDFTYGFNASLNFKHFDLVAFFFGKQGQDLYNLVWADLNEGEGDNNATTDMLKRWTPSNTNTNVPRAVTGNPGQNTRPSSRFIEDGSFLRLQNLQIGYDFAPILSKKINLTRCRLYISGQNLFTITNYHGYNPEIGKLNEGARSSLTRGIDFAMYPIPRTLEAGLQLDF